MERICSVPGCGGKHEAKGFCMTHYSRLLRGDEVEAPLRRKGQPPSPCSVDGCENRAVIKGLCKTHDARRRRGADLTAPVRVKNFDSSCLFEGCEKIPVAFGLCTGHRRQQKLYGDLELRPLGSGKRRGCGLDKCAVSGCDRAQYARAMCQKHHARATNHRLTVIQLQQLILTPECPVCFEEMTERTSAIDHDHTCCPGQRGCGNCVMGVICARCNAGIGYFMNHPGIMTSAIDYLLRTRAPL